MTQLKPAQVEELRERSKNDAAIIVGSEIRQLCDLALSALHSNDASRKDLNAEAWRHKNVALRGEPVAWYHTDFGVLELSRVQRNGWKPLYAAPQPSPAEAWIRVEDALPETADDVLATNLRGDMSVAYFHQKHKDWFGRILKPTHWQPLPAPPGQTTPNATHLFAVYWTAI